MDNNTVRCEGWRRRGGAFTMGGLPKWTQCGNDAIVSIEATQDNKTKSWPACMICWKEAIEYGIKINEVIPINEPTQS